MHSTTKITVKISEELLVGFEAQLQRMPVKRDQFLNRVLAQETERLRHSLKDKPPLSRAANRYISQALKRRGALPTNLTIDSSVARNLNHLVSENNLVRDAFFNLLLIWLRSSDSLLKFFGFPREHEAGKLGRFSFVGDLAPVSPMKALEAVFSDPLWALHDLAKQDYGVESLYELRLPPPAFDWCACHLEDEEVPGTRAHGKYHREISELAASLESLELDALGGTYRAREEG